LDKSTGQPIVKWSKGFNGSMSVAALLLPLMVAAESHIRTQAPGAAPAVTAHVNFKIIIPKVLYLRVGSGSDRAAGADTVAVMSNGRNVSLNATVRSPDPDAHTSDLDVRAPGRVVIGAAARKVIAQDALCTAGDAHSAPAPAEGGHLKVEYRQVVCTVSMP
jgi:hypothetical protein